MKQLDELLGELREEYLESLPKRADLIEQALRSNDFKTVITEFHKLKGTGRTYGLGYVTDIAQLCEEIYENNYTATDAAEIGLRLILDEESINKVDRKLVTKLHQIRKKSA